MKQIILTASDIQLKLQRIAIQVLENNFGVKSFELIGIIDRGAHIAELLKQELERNKGIKANVHSITLDKANPLSKPILLKASGINFNNKVVILVDDVANSGKTLFYAIKPLMDFAPSKVQFAVLVDRQHKQFPIVPDYVGISISTTLQEMITVDIGGKTNEPVAYLN